MHIVYKYNIKYLNNNDRDRYISIIVFFLFYRYLKKIIQEYTNIKNQFTNLFTRIP